MTKENTTLTNNSKSPLFYFGGVLLLVSIASSFMLAGTKLGIIKTLPGCGVGSGCDAVTNGPWGSIPAIGWPVSFVGLAWFIAVFVGWIRNNVTSNGFMWIVRIGVLASIGFFFVMLGIGHFCKWCAVAHIGNVLFWIVAETLHSSGRAFDNGSNRKACPSIPFFGVFVFVSVVLGIGMAFVNSVQKQQDEAAEKQNVIDVVSGGASESTLKLLDATHRIGPDDAPVQIVIFTDYQCPDCKRYESQLSDVVSKRDDVSLSVKHFPMCSACNEHMGGRTLHANACWAARAAETAYILGGQEGWEKMHAWLFEEDGRFTDETLPPALSALGFDPREFIGLMTSDRTLKLVQDNTDDAIALGISFTPMIFINGVEYLWYYGGKQTPLNELVDLAIDEINRGGGGLVAPPSASEKMVEDWRRGRVFNPPGHDSLSWRGDGPIEFVVWGDYQAPFSIELDNEINTFLTKNGERIKYAFRPFPVDDSCNAGVSGYPTKYDGSCQLSKLVEAVNLLSGNEKRWEMHDWILSQQQPVSVTKAMDEASRLSGLDYGVLQDVMGGIDVSNRVRLDIMSKNGVWRRGLPVITVNGRYVPKWKSKSVSAQEFFKRIVDIAESENVGGIDASDGARR